MHGFRRTFHLHVDEQADSEQLAVDRAIEKAAKKVTKAIDKGDYDAVVKAVNEGNDKIIEAASIG